MGDTIDSDTMGVSDTTARGLLMLRPIPMFTTDTDWDTSDMLDTSDTDTDTDTAMDTCTARGLLMLSLRLRPIPTFSRWTRIRRIRPWSLWIWIRTRIRIRTRPWCLLRRGLLMLRPIPTFSTVDSDTPDMDWDTSDMLDTISDTDTDSAMVSITASRLHQDLSVNQLGQKWIVISLNFPSPVLQVQCYHTKSLVMVSRKQENQSGKNQTNIKIT